MKTTLRKTLLNPVINELTMSGVVVGLLLISLVRPTCAQQSDVEESLPAPATKAELDINQHFCDVEPRDKPCSTIPKDVTDFSASRVYMLIEQNAQNPFDIFSWKSFVALNWPVEHNGDGLESYLDPARTPLRRWQTYATLESLFGVPKSGICQHQNVDPKILVTSEYIQAQGQPLIDQDGNYVVFDVRVNPEMEKYIRVNGLNTVQGQQKFKNSGAEINFPRGHYDNAETRMGGSVGALEIKTAWRIMNAQNDEEMGRFLVVDGKIEIAADRTTDGVDLCLPVKLGLVGFHIVHRTESGNGGDWVWTTFEHVDNAPYAETARGPNSIFSKPLFPDGCQATANHDRKYSFFDSSCANCESNAARVNLEGWRWSSQPPYAGAGIRPPQVTRCWKPSLGTRWINRTWQEKLSGTVWQYYALSTTQWKGANKGQLFPHGEVPRYLTNSTMETYIQTQEIGTCLGCHAEARTVVGQPANFSFVLSRVPRE